MVKIIAFTKRRAELSIEAFQHHWRTTHARLVARQPGLRRYVQNHVVPGGDPEREPDFDGIAEAWFDDPDDGDDGDDANALRDLRASPEYAAVQNDEANLVEPSSLGFVATDEIVVVDGPPPDKGAKLIAFLRKRPELAIDPFQKHWREIHAPIAAAIPGLRRYLQCHVRSSAYAKGREPAYDGIAMSWFDDHNALRAASQSSEYARTRADESHFLAPERVRYVVAREVEIELPAAAAQ